MMQSSETPAQPRVRLTEARLNRGLSQQDVAESIQTTHVNVSRWERGITKPSPYFRRKLSKLFGMSEEELDLIPPAPLPAVAGNGKSNGESPASRGGRATAATAEALPVNSDLPPIYDPAIPLGAQNPLVGRDKELAQIKQRLKAGGSVALTALNGLPGVGKTALSIALAHDPEIRAHFKDGILWAGLGPNPNMPGLLSRWGTLLGISANQMASLSNNEAWAKAIRNAIGMRTMLLVLDDAWVLEEALTVRVGGPNCAHLVTTRFPNLAAHMTVGGATIIQELGEEESISLLRQLAPQAVDREAQKVHALVQAVGGLPLALTLMGNYLRKQAASGPARRISAALEKLSSAETRLQIEEPHVPAESHPSLSVETPLSLQSVIAVTDQMLSDRARAALYALAVFPPKPNTFSEEAALVVAACTTDELDALSDSGLLEINGGERYQLHQIIADYARLHLKDAQLQEAQERLIEYVLDYVEEHRKDYELLELESGTILATLEMTYELKKNVELVEITNAFAPFLILRGFYVQVEHYLRRAYEISLALQDSNNIPISQLYLGEVAQKQGNYPQAESFFQEGLILARQSENNALICDLLEGLGAVKQKQGNFEDAEAYLQEGLKNARQINDQERIIALLTGLGGVTIRRGNYIKAQAILQEGLTLARDIGNRELIYSLLKILGSVYGIRGDYVQSELYLQEGLTLARQIGDSEQIGFLLTNLGATAGGQGNYPKAERCFLEGLALARQIGHREQICLLLSNLGDVSEEQGNHPQAEAYYQEGLALARQIGHRDQSCVLLSGLGLALHMQGHYTQSEIYLRESLNLARQIGRPQYVAMALYEYGNLFLSRKEVDFAEASFNEMLDSISSEDKELFGLAQYGLARAARTKGDQEGMKKHGEVSILQLEAIGSRKMKEVKNWLDLYGGR